MGKTVQRITEAQRLKNYRAKLKEDSVRYEEYLQKERERYQRRKEKGKIKLIGDLGKRGQRNQRKQWRKRKRAERDRKKTGQIAFSFIKQYTPPQTPDHSSEDIVPLQEPQSQTRRQRGRKKVKRSRSAAYRTIERLTAQLSKKEKESEKYRKRYERLKKRTEENAKATDIPESPRKKTKQQLKGSRVTSKLKKQLLLHNCILEELRSKFKSLNKESDKQVFSKMITGNVLKKYGLLGSSMKDFLGVGHRRIASNRTRSDRLVYEKKPRKDRKKVTVGQRVIRFLEQDINSRVMPGKKDTITRKKLKKQKRVLCDTLKNSYKKFLLENKDVKKLSYTAFLRLRPIWIVTPKITDRDTCVCKLHSNMQSMVDKLHKHGAILSNNTEECVKEICCNIQNKSCMYRECNECRNRELNVTNCELGRQVHVYEWLNQTEERTRYKPNGESESFNVTIVKREKVQSSLGELIERTNILLTKFCRHIFNIHTQYTSLKNLKDNLSTSECLIHIDFSENYECKVSEEVQAMHFGASRSQISLHTGVLYIANEKPFSFCSVSESTRHDPVVIWSHLNPVLEEVKKQNPEVEKVHFLSDGPTTQYRSKSNFFLLCSKMKEYGFRNASWNFSEASHGKGAPDGIGGVLKRTADRLVAQGKDILDAETFIQQVIGAEVKVKIYRVTEQEIVNF